MKVLISAIACDPFSGSEGAYGWRACRALAEEHEVWILTHESNRKSLERAASQQMAPPSMRFIYLGSTLPFHPNRLAARAQSWMRYRAFQRSLLPLARKEHEAVGFDLAHHVTFTTWRVQTPLWRLDIPLVWGPISGTEPFPLRLLSTVSFSAKCFELARIAAGWISWLSPGVRKALRRASVIPVPHRQAQAAIVRMRGSKAGVLRYGNFFFPEATISSLRRASWAEHERPLRIFAAGNLEGRKGVGLALEALALARDRGLKFFYQVTSRGPELAYLEWKAKALGLSGSVKLGQRFEAQDYAQALQTFDICLLPTLRDSAALSMMEAMLAGCVPIVADWCGPGEIVTDETGFKIPVTTRRDMADCIADVLLKLDGNRGLMMEMGRRAHERIAGTYNEAVFRCAMRKGYEEALHPTGATGDLLALPFKPDRRPSTVGHSEARVEASRGPGKTK